MPAPITPIPQGRTLSVTDEGTIVDNVGSIIFNGVSEVSQDSEGVARVLIPTIPPPFNLIVQDGSTAVNETTLIAFTGVTVTDLGGGNALVELPPPVAPGGTSGSFQFNNGSGGFTGLDVLVHVSGKVQAEVDFFSILQPGASVGGSELRLSHDGSNSLIRSMNGDVQLISGSKAFRVSTGGPYLTESDAAKYFWSSNGMVLAASRQLLFHPGEDVGASGDAGINRVGSGSVEITNGTVGQYGTLACGVRSAANTTVETGLKVGKQLASVTPDVGCGVAIDWTINSSTTPNQVAGRVSFEWETATDGSRKAIGRNFVADTALREYMTVSTDGANPEIGFLGGIPVGRITLPVDATDEASAITLVNAIKAALINFGLCD